MSGNVTQEQIIHLKEIWLAHYLKFYILVNFIIQDFYFEKYTGQANTFNNASKLMVMHWLRPQCSSTCSNSTMKNLSFVLLTSDQWILCVQNHLRYTNADLKIWLYVWVHVKAMPWKFHTLNPKNSQVIYPWILFF